MAANHYRSNLDHPFWLCPTSKFEHLNPTKSFKVGNVIPIFHSIEKIHPNYVPQPHLEKHMFDQWVVMLRILGVWLLLHAKVTSPK
jgi:hypothetical protein